MREPPVDLSDDTLATGLGSHYGLTVTAVTFLPLGQDSSAWVYRVQTAADAAYFLKVRKSVTNIPGLFVPRFLQDHGVAPVVAPLPTATGAMWAEVAGYALILYPFIAETTGMTHGMSEQQWRTYGAILRQIHTAALAPDVAQFMKRETYVPEGTADVGAVATHLHRQTSADPVAQAFSVIWQERSAVIRALVARAEELGQHLAQRALPCVLCHGDIHTNNVLLDASGAVWIVDWDDTVVAPKERDLMFAVGGGIKRAFVGPREEELFLQGYGTTALDPLALAYYRYAWAVGDIGAYGAQAVLRSDLGLVSRQAAVDRFLSLFEPGSIVALALASDPGAA